MVNFLSSQHTLLLDIVKAYIAEHPYDELSEQAEQQRLVPAIELDQRFTESLNVVKKTTHNPGKVVDLFLLERVALRAMALTDDAFTPVVVEEAVAIEYPELVTIK